MSRTHITAVVVILLALAVVATLVIKRRQRRESLPSPAVAAVVMAVVASPTIASAAPREPDSDIHIKSKRQNEPEFEREYTAIVGDGILLKITLKTFIHSRMDTSWLTQRDGKAVYFRADAVADHIIDRELYPLVQAKVDEIIRLDREFLASKPSEFTDDKGTTWRRVEKGERP